MARTRETKVGDIYEGEYSAYQVVTVEEDGWIQVVNITPYRSSDKAERFQTALNGTFFSDYFLDICRRHG